MRSATFGKRFLIGLKGSERMTTNMLLTTITMVLALAIAAANDCPALQVILAGMLYAILIAMVAMEFWM